MKKYLIIVSIIILSGSLFAQMPWTTHSFRFKATSGIFWDDLDIILDPGDIPTVEGYRLWTNLSNIVTGFEDIDGGKPNYMTDDRFAIGEKSDFFGFSNAFLFHNIGVRNGTASDSFSSSYLYDPSSGMLTRIDDHDKYKHQYDTAGMDYYFGLAKKFGNSRLGLGIWHRGRMITDLPYHNEHSQDMFRYDGNTPVLTSSFSSATLFEEKENNKITDFMLSYWMPFAGMELGLRFIYGNYSVDNELLQTSYSFLDRAPDQTLTSRADTTSWLEEDINLKGTNYGFELVQNIDNDERGSWRFEETYRHGTAKDNNGIYLDSFSGIDEIALVPATMINSLDSVRNGGLLAEEKNDFFSFYSLFKIDIGERARFGFAAFLSFNRNSFVKNYQDIAFNWNSAFNDGDSLPTANDSTVTATQTLSWEEETSMWTKTLSIPVGIEFDFTPSVAVRLGTRHTRRIINDSFRKRDTGSSTEIVRVEKGDGTTYEYTNNSTIEEYNNDLILHESNTIYSYGIGYQVNDHLQIDFMGFSDLTDLGSWNLSATILF